MSALIHAIDHIFSFEKNTVRRDVRRLAAEIRQLRPVAALAMFAAGWAVGLAGSWVVLAILAALVCGLVLARPATIEAPTVSSTEAPALPSSLADTLAAVGLQIKKLEFAPPAANGRAKTVKQ